MAITLFLLCLFPFAFSQAALSCQDAKPTNHCVYWKGLQYCKSTNQYYQFMRKSCQKTCGFCQGPATPRPPPPATPAPRCKDIRSTDDCVYWKGLQYCKSTHQFYQFMKKHCAKSCGFCQGPATTVRPRTNPPVTVRPTPGQRCKDISSNQICVYWKGLQYCKKTSIYYQHMKKNCPKTCGFCQGPVTNPPRPRVTTQPTPGKSQLACGFERNFCQWVNEASSDNADWATGTVSRGPSSGAKGSAKYAYVNTMFSNKRARLVLPLRSALPSGVTNKGTMCMRFNFITGSGNLKIMEQMYPTSGDRNPTARTLFTVRSSGAWYSGWVQVTVDNRRKIIMEGTTGFSTRVVVDNVEFFSGRC